MKVLLSGGKKTNNIVTGIQKSFTTSGDEFVVIEYLDDIMDMFSRGEYFDKALIAEQSITRDGMITDEMQIRQRVNKFANDISAKNSKNNYIFLSQSKEICGMIYDEILPIAHESAVVFMEPPYKATFFKELIIREASEIPSDWIYEPEITLPENTDLGLVEDDGNSDESMTDMGLEMDLPDMTTDNIFDGDLGGFDFGDDENNVNIDINEGTDTGIENNMSDNEDSPIDSNDTDMWSENGDSIDDVNSGENVSGADAFGTGDDFDNFGDSNTGFDNTDNGNWDNTNENWDNTNENWDNTNGFGDADNFDESNGFSGVGTGLSDDETIETDEMDPISQSSELPDYTEQQNYNDNSFDNNGFDSASGFDNNDNGFDNANDFDNNGFDNNEFDSNGFENGFDNNNFDNNDFDNQQFDNNGFDNANDFDSNGFDNQQFDNNGFDNANDNYSNNNGMYDDNMGQNMNDNMYDNNDMYNQQQTMNDNMYDTNANNNGFGGDMYDDVPEQTIENNNGFGGDMYGGESDYQKSMENSMYDGNPSGFGGDMYGDNQNNANMAGAVGAGLAAGAVGAGALMNNMQNQQQKQPTKKRGLRGLLGKNRLSQQQQQMQQQQQQYQNMAGQLNNAQPVDSWQQEQAMVNTANVKKSKVNVNTIKEQLKPFASRGNSIVVTGCGGCGTSVVAYNLANILNQLGYTVLLVDMDTEGRTQSYISKTNYDSMEPDGANLMSAVNSSNGISAQESIVKQGFHLLTMGLGTDTAPVSELLHKEKLSRFVNLAKTSHNFVIYDIPFNSATGFLSEITYMTDNLVLVADASNWGITKMMLNVCNISVDDMQDTIFSRAQLVFNRYRNLTKVLGKKVRTGVDITKVIDMKVQELIGEDPGFHFEDLHIAGIINDDPDIENGWFENLQYSDTAKGQAIFLELVEHIVLKK